MDRQTEQTRAYSLDYFDAGLVPIPSKLDGSKSPALDGWKRYQTERPTRQQVDRWFSRPAGILVLMGTISGGAECIDFDDPAPFGPILDQLPSDLIARLAIYETPKGGSHIVYRCFEIFKSVKLARRPDKSTRIETRGEGGAIIAEGSPLHVHKAGLPYCHYMGRRLESLGTITPGERKRLWLLCSQYDETNELTPSQKLGRMQAEQEYLQQHPVVVSANAIERASKYLARMEPAIQGANGSGACFRAACKLVGRFGLSAGDALHLLTSEYNPRCAPPWSDRELEHKVESAMRCVGRNM